MIGLEPTLEEHIERLVAVFRQVRRVLRDDGTLWLNYGDAYAGGGGQGGRTGPSWQQGDVHKAMKTQGGGLKPKDLMMMPARVALALQADGSDRAGCEAIGRAIWAIVDDYGYDNPPPDRVLAVLERLETEYAQARGDSWYLRSEIVWHKPNPMPESVTDRPTSSHEKLFLFAKSGSPTFWINEDGRGSRTKPAPDYRWCDEAGIEQRVPASWATSEKYEDQDPRYKAREQANDSSWKRRNKWRGRDYFYDAEAVRVPNTTGTAERLKHGNQTASGRRVESANDLGMNEWHERNNAKQRGHDRPHQGFDDQWDGMTKAEQQANGANLRNVWRIPVHAYKGAHFATFPPALVEPCIKAGTSQKGVCGACGAPWVRQVDKVLADGTERDGGERNLDRNDFDKVRMGDGAGGKTLGWHPSCVCHPAELTEAINEGSDHPNSYNMARYLAEKEGWLKPAVVLDPFGGAGTVALVAQRLGRKALCIELSPEYARMAQQRCEQDLPMTRRPNREKPGEFRLEFSP